MSINIELETKKMIDSRLMSTSQDIDNFEDAIENIYNQNKPEYIRNLCKGFDDSTEHYEVMYGLVHAIEAFYKSHDPKVVMAFFLESVNEMVPHAEKWLSTMLKGLLNHNDFRLILRDLLKVLPKEKFNIVKDNIKSISEKNPTHFNPLILEVLG